MPAAVAAWAVSAGATALGASALVANLAGLAVSMAISSSMANRAKAQADAASRASYNASLRDITMVVDNPLVPRNIVLGEGRTSGPLWPWFTYGSLGQYHVFGVVLAGHECDSIPKILFNEDEVTLDGAGNVIAPAKYVKTETFSISTSFFGQSVTLPYPPINVSVGRHVSPDGAFDQWEPAAYTLSGNTITLVDWPSPMHLSCSVNYSYTVITPLFVVKKYLGAPGQAAAPELIAAAAASGNPAAWDATRVGTGICYVTVQMTADFNILGDIGVPKVSAVVRGVKAYDPRSGITAWTANPPVLSRWFLVDCPYSPKTLASEIDDAECIASANVCDELVQFAADRWEKRYTCNGVLSCEEIPLANLNHILDSMDGDSLPISGKWQLVAGYYKVPTLTLDEDALSEANITILPYTQKSDLFNMITGTFVSPAFAYQPVSYEPVTNAVYQAEDGDEVLPQDMSFVLVNDAIRCQMIAWQRLSRARNGQTIQLGTNLKGYDTSPLKNVNVHMRELLGEDVKVFSVRRRGFTAPRLTYTLQETSPAVWNWDYTKATAVVDIPNTSFPDVLTVPVLTGVTTASGNAELIRLTSGAVASRIRVTWAAVNNVYVQNGGLIRWQYRLVPDGAWLTASAVPGSDTELFIYPVEDLQAYQLRGQCVSSSGREGNWCPAVLEVVVGKTADPRPPGVVAVTRDFTIFSLSPDFDVAGYEVRYNAGSNQNGSVASPLHTGLISGSPWPMPVRLYGVNTVMVRAVDDGGRTSIWVSDTQDFGIPDAANIADLVDFDALGFPGQVTNGSIVGGDLVADFDPAADFWGNGLGADFWYRDGAADYWGGAQFLQMVYVASYVSPYASGAIFLALQGSGARTTIEYRVDGATVGDFWADDDGDGDFWGGSAFWGTEQSWQPWMGVLTPTMAYLGLQFRITIDAGSVQGVIDQLALRTEMPTISQTFGNVLIDAAGTLLLPANGLSPLTFIKIEDVQITPIADGSGAISGRVKAPGATPAGIPVELLNGTPVAVTGHSYITVSGY